jgi:nucleoside-diphosphate-sugar epimerase
VLRRGDRVVNCALGNAGEMIDGLRNLLGACAAAGVQRFVHLSSVTVYGPYPGPDCVSETGRPAPVRNSYGWYKLRQDGMVRQAHRDGLSSVVLCPPHVIGPGSRSLGWFSTLLRKGTFALVDSGRHPCVLVDIANLAEAVELALRADYADGQRCFITNGDDLEWVSLAGELCEVEDLAIGSVPQIASGMVRNQAQAEAGPGEMLRAAAGAVLRDARLRAQVREWLERRPALARCARGFRRMGGKVAAGGAPAGPPYNRDLLTQQLRDVRHSPEKARRLLGYHPRVDFHTSMSRYREWCGRHVGQGTEWWPLARLLYT